MVHMCFIFYILFMD